MIPGSGQVDRDENHKRLRLNVFGELAGHLAERGFDSLRYDKRGVGQSEGDFWTAGLADNAADVMAAVEFLRTHGAGERSRIFLLGHSEGAYLAVRVAAKTPDLGGVVLLAGGARPGEEELRWQGAQVARSLTGLNAFLIRLLRIDVVKAQAKQIGRIKASSQDSFRVQLVAKVNAKWMREFLAYDPTEDLTKITCPILAITGAKDIQVDPDNLERMAGLVKAPFERHVVPDVTHLLRSDDGPPRLSTYKEQVTRRLDPRVVRLILDWLEAQSAGWT
jgi:pimeloyl-ACP methyl ester carboxylesterase